MPPRRYLILLILSAALPVLAQPPKAIITGPKEANVGDLVILDASQSTGLSYAWALLASDKTYLPVDGGVRVVFASGTPGEYIFALVAAGQNNNGGAAADVATWTVKVLGTSPSPVPSPAPQPVPPAPGPVVNPHPRPSAALQAATAAVRAIKLTTVDATSLAEIYAEAASMVALSGDQAAENALRTTADLRDHLADTGKSLGLVGRYAGLGDAIDAFLLASIADGDRATTTADVAALRALAWAVWETGR